MDPSQDFKSLEKDIQASLLATIKSANRLAGEDLDFQRSANPTSVGDRLEDQTSRLLSLTGGLLKAASKATGGQKKTIGILEDAGDIDINWNGIVDVVDGLLEKADTCLDEYTGLVKRKGDFPTAEGPKQKKSRNQNKLDYNVFRANIVKPQNAFEQKPDNFDLGPWKPLLTVKPHAAVPLENSLGTFLDEQERTQYDYSLFLPLLIFEKAGKPLAEMNADEERKYQNRVRRMIAKLRKSASLTDTNGNFRYKHPYETEILSLEYPASTFEKRTPIPYQPVETTSAIWVDTYEGVLVMLDELKQATEIAVDLEHHDYRTYSGLLSLMQISTREKDWIVDTLKPWRQKLEVLNEVFADPNILKVNLPTVLWSTQQLMLRRFSMAHSWILCGCRETWACTLLGFLTLFMLAVS